MTALAVSDADLLAATRDLDVPPPLERERITFHAAVDPGSMSCLWLTAMYDDEDAGNIGWRRPLEFTADTKNQLRPAFQAILADLAKYVAGVKS